MGKEITTSLHKPFAVLVLFALVAWQSGWATPGLFPSLSYETRSKLGTICVVSARYQPEVKLQKPPGRSTQALKGAEECLLPVRPLPSDRYMEELSKLLTFKDVNPFIRSATEKERFERLIIYQQARNGKEDFRP